MKIVCGSCGAKYSIADEKVQGKVFKIRCKKCSNVIVVKGDSQQDDAHSQEAFGDSGMAGAYGGTSAAAEWYVVVDGEQVGPISPEEIEAYYASGRINDQSFAWRDGLGDWVALSELDEFAHLAHLGGVGADTTSMMDAPFGSDADGYDDDATSLMPASDFRAQMDANEAQAAATAGTDGGYASDGGFADSNADPYGASSSSSGYDSYNESSSDGGYDAGGGYDSGGYDDGGGYDSYGGEDSENQGMFSSFDSGADGADSDYDSFGGFGGAESEESDSSSSGVASANDMIGQRNENSVLFSLSSLDQVSAVSGGGDSQSAGAGNAGAPGDGVTEGSGLIDIQALASAHKVMKGSGQGGDSAINAPGADDPFGAGTMSMPALMPMGSHKSNKPLIIGLAVVGLLLLAAIGGGFYYLATKEEPKTVIQKIVQTAPAPAEPKAAAADPNAAKVQAEAAAAAKAVENGDDAPKGEDGEALAEAEEAKEDEENEENDDSSDNDDSARRADRRDPEPRKERTRRASSDNDDEEEKSEDIFDLLDKNDDEKKRAGGSGSSGGAAAPASLPKKLSRSMVQNTVAKYNGRIHNCYTDSNRKKLSGAVFVKYTIQPSGRISSARISTGKFKGTDVGTCVERVVRSMKFPATQSSLTVNYPFILK
jgi:predicted Zn finger-like uncharacterized protein